MYNAKPIIASALSTDASLIAIIPKIRMFDGVSTFGSAPVYPYLTYEELTNIEHLHGDDEEIASEVTFRINVFGTASLSVIAGHINRIMHGINFGRNYAQDQDEVLETGIVIKHKIYRAQQANSGVNIVQLKRLFHIQHGKRDKYRQCDHFLQNF